MSSAVVSEIGAGRICDDEAVAIVWFGTSVKAFVPANTCTLTLAVFAVLVFARLMALMILVPVRPDTTVAAFDDVIRLA